MATIRRDNRGHYFAYSNHVTFGAAEAALEQYYASGRISDSERPYVAKSGRLYAVFFPL